MPPQATILETIKVMMSIVGGLGHMGSCGSGLGIGQPLAMTAVQGKVRNCQMDLLTTEEWHSVAHEPIYSVGQS
jgi:hypothetical protein